MKAPLPTVSLSVALTLFFSPLLPAANTVTVIGSVTTDFDYYGDAPSTFAWKEVEEANPNVLDRLTKNLDDSLLVVFAEQTPSKIYSQVFSSPTVREALKKLLQRGGLIYFDFTSSAILGSLPKDMKDFFAEIDAFLVTDKNYAYVGNTSDDKETGLPNPDLKHPFLTEPNAMATARCEIAAIRCFRGTLPETCKVLFITKETHQPIMILQEGILGKGRIINSYVYPITRTSKNEFIANILQTLYGK